MHFVSSSIYQKAMQLSINEGMPVDQFKKHKEFKEIRQGDKYIPITLLYEIYEWSTENLEPGFSVRQGMQLDSDDYGTLGLSWKTCWKAGEVLDRVERYMILVTDHGSLQIEELEGQTILKMNREPSRIGVEIANEVSFVMLVRIIEEVTGKKICPTKVTFKHAKRSLDSFRSYFKCAVDFSSPNYTIQFSTVELDIRTIKADKSIHQFLLERMNEEKQGIHANTDRMLRDLHKLVTEALPSGIPSVIQTADHLGMSARTLKRRLSEKGLTFRDYVQQIQREVCQELLMNTSQSIAEIAFQTGFSEQSAFNRAFLRWTNQSPTDYRKNA